MRYSKIVLLKTRKRINSQFTEGKSIAICRALLRSWSILASLILLIAFAITADAQEYTFTSVADSAEDGFNPFSFGCSSINAGGDIAFRAGRLAPDGFNTISGIYRINADGTLTTIAEDAKRFNFIGRNPSMNDLGQVSFAARIDGGKKEDTESILRGEGKKLTTIASTADEFNFFGFDTSISNSGEVAFRAELDEEFNFDEGLFSGQGDKSTTTHFLNSSDITLDGEPARFGGRDSRPSINNLGDIAFDENIQPNFDSGIFAGQESIFKTIAAPDPDVSVQEPTFNDSGTAAFSRSFFDETIQEFVEEIVTGNGGPLTNVADTRGEFSSFGFRPPSINNGGNVAFLAFFDDFVTSGIFVGPDPVEDRVIVTGDTLDGATVTNLVFCEEGLNDLNQLSFIATFNDPNVPEGVRVGVFLATPSP
jgi:hypothetical protein